MPKPKVGSVGLQIFIETGVDLSTAQTLHIRYKKPDDSTGFFIAEEQVVGQKIGCQYITADSTDIDQAGVWTFQVYAVSPTFELWGTETTQEFDAPMAGSF